MLCDRSVTVEPSELTVTALEKRASIGAVDVDAPAVPVVLLPALSEDGDAGDEHATTMTNASATSTASRIRIFRMGTSHLEATGDTLRESEATASDSRKVLTTQCQPCVC